MQHRRMAVASLPLGVLLAGCGSSGSAAPTTTTTTLARGQQGPVSAIPWSQVGSGWLLATWSKNTPVAPGERAPGNLANPPSYLYLVDHQGGRYLIRSAPNSNESLAGWSGDDNRALMVSGSGAPTFTQIDLATGRPASAFTLRTSNSVFYQSVSYSRPNGLALLVVTQTNGAQLLQRYSPTGSLQVTYPHTFTQVGRFDGTVLSSPDGQHLVLGTYQGVAYLGNDGAVVSQVAVPGTTYCSPTRWWAPGVVLASCMGASSGSRLYKIPVDGGAVAAMTVVPKAPDAGDLNAWAVGGGVYVQDAGGCGELYLAKLQANGATTPVTVRIVVNGESIFVLGATSTELALQATVVCGSGKSALWYNPTTRVASVVLGPPINGGGVTTAISYPDPTR